MDNKIIASFVFAGVLTGALITLQLKSPVPISSGFPADQLEVQNDLIKSFSDEQALLKSQIVTLREQIEENQHNNTSVAKTSNLKTLNKLKEKIGLTNITGPGLSIILDDSKKINRDDADVSSDSLIHASDLRDIINILRTAKPEAISINKQRIINTSPISAVGNGILINNSRLLPPFQIDVVGDSDLINQLFKNSPAIQALLERSNKNGLTFRAEYKNEHTIPLYNGDLTLKYTELISS